MKTKLILAAAAMLATAGSANAASVLPTYTFNTVGNTPFDGTYGNPLVFGTAESPTLSLSVTAWQSNLSTNAITSAYLGAYSGGLGVTGKGDANGADNLHQIDNVGSYTDFLLLEFNRAVTIDAIKTNSYGINGVSDNDAVWYDASKFVTSTWNSTAGFSDLSTVPAAWSNVAAGGNGVSRATGATTASSKWLVGAAFTPSDGRNDGFKFASVTVSTPVSPVPEPATWAMMLMGAGLAGVVLRRSRRHTPVAARLSALA